MRAIIHRQFGEPSQVLEIADLPIPQPGPGQIRVRASMATIHNHDIATIQGRYGYRPALPAIAGTEAVGVVDAVGEGVGLSVGLRVGVFSTRGVWAESFVVDASEVVPLPASINDELGAQLVSMPASALLLLNTLKLQKNQWIIQNAANGAVGVTIAMLG